MDLRIGFGLRHGTGQCPQPAGLILQQQGQGWALGNRKWASARTQNGKAQPGTLYGVCRGKPETAWWGGWARLWDCCSSSAELGTYFRDMVLGSLGNRPREVKQHTDGYTASQWQRVSPPDLCSVLTTPSSWQATGSYSTFHGCMGLYQAQALPT